MPPASLSQQAWTVNSVVQWAADDFRARGMSTPRLDAELLVAHALSTTRIRLVIEATRTLEDPELRRLRELVVRRRAHEPIAYILGEREFYGRPFLVDRRALVPRPETEVLVGVGLELTRPLSMCTRALDLCTGSGCVAITVARERPTSLVTATDISGGALALARDNALRLGAYRVALRAGDLYEAIADSACRFDLIAANPPYIPSEQIASLAPDIRAFEPRTALDGGEDGLALMRRIVHGAPTYLAPKGVLAVEVGAGQAQAVVRLFEETRFEHIDVRRDYGGIERVVSGVLKDL
jgi:release factor glutamine methyltransferase